MKDHYASLNDLRLTEKEGTDFQIVREVRESPVLILAPHGGGIEPGTSEIASAVAGLDHSIYQFEGKKANGNKALHITSTRYSESNCEAMLGAAHHVVAIHGEESEADCVFVGGLDLALRERIASSLAVNGFKVDDRGRPDLAGVEKSNICNRGCTKRGVQLEISAGLRASFFGDVKSRKGRETKTELFRGFEKAVRSALPAPKRYAMPDYRTIRQCVDPHQQVRTHSCTQSAVEMVLKLFRIIGPGEYPVQAHGAWDKKGFEPYTDLKTERFGSTQVDYFEDKFDNNLYQDWRTASWERGLELLRQGAFPIYSFSDTRGFHCWVGIPQESDGMQWITKQQVGPGEATIEGHRGNIWASQYKTEILIVRPS